MIRRWLAVHSQVASESGPWPRSSRPAIEEGEQSGGLLRTFRFVLDDPRLDYLQPSSHRLASNPSCWVIGSERIPMSLTRREFLHLTGKGVIGCALLSPLTALAARHSRFEAIAFMPSRSLIHDQSLTLPRHSSRERGSS